MSISANEEPSDGFTVPMVCECNQQVVFGCNLDLHDMCPVCYQRYPLDTTELTN